MNEIFLDTETTGLSFQEGHKIVEIACVETKDLIPTKKVFHKLINPKRDVPEQAVKIHGFTKEYLSKKETFDQVADEFLNFIKGKKIIIHNANFDLSFLNGELDKINKTLIDKQVVTDSLEVARNKFPGSSNSLDALCKRFNIDLSRRTKHNALLDCELLREVYINLLDAKEPKFNLSNQQVNTKYINSDKEYNKKIINISEIELKKHKEFLKTENRSLFTSNRVDIKKSNFYIVTVPTPIKKNKYPDLDYIKSAFNLKAFARSFLASAWAALSFKLNASSIALYFSTGQWLSIGSKTSCNLIANSTVSEFSSGFIFTLAIN